VPPQEAWEDRCRTCQDEHDAHEHRRRGTHRSYGRHVDGAHRGKQDDPPLHFFIVEVQGNYNTILGHDWIHANHCVPFTLHQFLIQWVGEEVEIVHADVIACAAMADSSSWSHYNIKCLSGQDISDCDFVSVSKDCFIPMSIKLVDDRLNIIM
jgi:hypothetical protein